LNKLLQAFADHKGTRTKILGHKIYEKLKSGNIDDESAKKWTKSIIEKFGKLKKEDKEKKEKNQDLEIEQLVHFSPAELENIFKLVESCIDRKSSPSGDELSLLTKERQAVDIALFGRMLADSPDYNIEAAVQVAHAISVHSVTIEDDYFTAVDDLNEVLNKVGAAHIGEGAFSAGLFYLYICIDRDLLSHNLHGDQVLINKSIAILTEAAIKVPPNGKQNSFASRAYASYVMAEIGEQQPRSLSVAFLKPVSGDDYLHSSIKALNDHKNSIDKVYGACSKDAYELNAYTGKGEFNQLINFVAA
jgi:CRISPR system Cascade subunit CasC